LTRRRINSYEEVISYNVINYSNKCQVTLKNKTKRQVWSGASGL
jgi:hypothetical protein